MLLTILFVLVGEVLIYIPSIARFRLVWLNERLAAAYLATVALDTEGASRLKPKVRAALLGDAGVLSITLHRPMAQLMLGEPAQPQRTFDLRDLSPTQLVPDALETLYAGGSRALRVIGPAPQRPAVLVDITLPEAPMRAAMLDYSVRILQLSVVLSLGVAVLLFLSLQLMIVRPLRRITAAMGAFRDRPEDATLDGAVVEPGRADEIGVVEREFAQMRERLRRALVEKARLAGLGAALGRVSHDLRNLLATAVLVSDRLESNPDPEVRRVASRLIDTLDRAVRLCAETLTYARSRPEPPVPRPVRPLQLVERLQAALVERPEPVTWRIDVDPDLELMVDGDQLYRVLLNLARNAYEAMGVEGGELRLASQAGEDGLRLTVADTGPGIPERVRERLFEPFAGSNKPGGTGLGLAICRELMRGQGGEIELRETSLRGTIFDLLLPARAVLREGGVSPRSRAMAARRLSLLSPLAVPVAASAAVAALAGCGYQGPPLAGYEGLQYKVASFYDARALEKDATCTRPRMTPVRSTVVEETPERVVMNVRYHFRDEAEDNNTFFPFGRGAGVAGRCNDWSERTFTLAKNTQGGLDVVAMTGPQRRLGPDSAMAAPPAAR